MDNTTNKCVQSCPFGYYSESLLNYICIVCNQLCLTCANSSSNCLSCNSSFVLFNNSCLNLCPSGTFNSSTNICYICDLSCSGCQNLSTNCIMCATGYARSGVGNLCTNNCPKGTVLYNGVCQCST